MPYKDPERRKQYQRDYHRDRYATDSEYRDRKIAASKATWALGRASRVLKLRRRRGRTEA